MKITKNILIIVGLSITVGCMSCTEPYTTYNAELINQSGANIKILPYREGNVGISDTLYLSNGEKLQIANGWHKGSIKVPFFESEKISIGYNDSLVVVYENIYSVPHFWGDPEIIPMKCHLRASSRNVTNRDNYIFFSKGSKRKGYKNNHYYTFTEADYEYAKE